MPSFTKKAIAATFLALLEKKPPEKITVKDVVDACGINRNTFYYYFQDIFAVMETLSADAVAALPEGLSAVELVTHFFRKFCEFVTENPRTAHNIISSEGLDGIERYFGPPLDEVIYEAFLRDMGENAPAALKMAAVMLRHGVLGVAADLTRRGMKEKDIEPAAARVRQVAEALSAGLSRGRGEAPAGK